MQQRAAGLLAITRLIDNARACHPIQYPMTIPASCCCPATYRKRSPSLPRKLRLVGLSCYQESGHRPARLPTYQDPRSTGARMICGKCADRRSPSEKCESPGVRGLLFYLADYQRAHAGRIAADLWPDHIRLPDLEPLFVCQTCGRRGVDIRPDWDWDTQPKAYRTLSALARCAPL